MNKVVFGAVIGVMGLVAGAAHADSIQVVTQLSVAGQSIQSQAQADFTPTSNPITMKVAGKTCTFGSSTQGSVPQGCNYTVVIDGNGVTPQARQASSVCMQTPMKCE